MADDDRFAGLWSFAAVRIGTSSDRPLGLLVEGSPLDETVELAYYVWFLRSGENEAVAIDAGFTPNLGRSRSVLPGIALADALTLLEIERLRSVFLTHVHWDHAGGLSLLPNAPVMLSQPEMDWLTQMDGRDPDELTYYDPESLQVLRHERDLSTFQSEIELIPGVARGRWVGGHTVGHAVVEMEIAERPWCFLGDLAYLGENLAKNRAPQIAVDKHRCTEIYASYKGDRGLLPGHDPATLDLLDHRIHEHVAVLVAN